MKKVFAVAAALVLLFMLVLAGSPASAGTYELSVPQVIGYYEAGGTDLMRYVDIDFGFTFSSINQVSFRWAGQAWTGTYWWWDGPNGYVPITLYGTLQAVVDYESGGGSAIKNCGDPPFDETQVLSGGTYDGLLDGKGYVQVRFEGYMMGYRDCEPPRAVVNEFHVIVDGIASGEPVPEPSSFLALVSGLGCLTSVLWRRRR